MLYLGRQRADGIDAVDVQQVAELLRPNLNVAAGHRPLGHRGRVLEGGGRLTNAPVGGRIEHGSVVK
jgi:hypothetical protein